MHNIDWNGDVFVRVIFPVPFLFLIYILRANVSVEILMHFAELSQDVLLHVSIKPQKLKIRIVFSLVVFEWKTPSRKTS